MTLADKQKFYQRILTSDPNTVRHLDDDLRALAAWLALNFPTSEKPPSCINPDCAQHTKEHGDTEITAALELLIDDDGHEFASERHMCTRCGSEWSNVYRYTEITDEYIEHKEDR